MHTYLDIVYRVLLLVIYLVRIGCSDTLCSKLISKSIFMLFFYYHNRNMKIGKHIRTWYCQMKNLNSTILYPDVINIILPMVNVVPSFWGTGISLTTNMPSSKPFNPD